MDLSRQPIRGLGPRDAAIAAVLLVAYELGALWGRALETMPGFTPWFPPPGITLAVLLAFGLRFIPVVFVAELVSALLIYHVQDTFTPLQVALNTAAITVGWGAAAWFLLTVAGIRRDLRRGSDLAWLVAIGVVGASLCVALAGTAIRFWAEGTPWDGYPDAVRTWLIGDALGVMSITPAALVIGAWWRYRVPDMVRREFLNFETAAQAVCVIATPFLALEAGNGRGSALVIAVLPIVWVALRRSFEVTVGALTVLAAATTVAIKLELGGPVDRADTQLALLLFAIIALAVGWAVREQRRSAARLAHQALHDPVTGLPNRVRFLDEVESTLAGNGHCAILYFDLDHFKLVNDSLGHAEGDRLLAAVAERLAPALGDAAFLARFGGDEFTALVREGHEPAAVADLLLRTLEPAFEVNGKRLLTSASIGVAADRGGDAGTLLRHADMALQEAKQIGGGAVAYFDAPLAARAERRATIEQGLRVALENDDFKLVYQPVVTLADGHVVFAEALLRWDLDGTAVPPNEFVPVAQDTGLIMPLGRRVVSAACREAARWHGEVAVSVNVSPAQLRSHGLVEHVRQTLRLTGLAPERLVIELTEGALVDDAATVVRTLEELRTEGVRTALDDFGTGYSSLAYLESLPLDMVKLDREFVARLGTSDRAEGVLSAAIDLAHAVGLPVVAEGVETSQQAHILFLLGCDLAQGFLFARPGPAAEVLPRVTARERPSGTFVVRTADELSP
jgi:diguanylate cyclase (GGDEF)-like protein